jgi:arylsulfatase A-like enzyme
MMRAALLGLALAGCAPSERSGAENIVLIVMDTVRVDHLSAYGYPEPTSPFLERLAADGVRFERAWSTSGWTLPAHASMFTGLLPAEHGATQSHLELKGSPSLLAERLSEAGYQCAGFSNNPWVSDKTGLAAGFAQFGELWRKTERPRAPLADPSSVAVERWLEGERDPERPFFLFVNLMEAHGPYEPDWRYAWSTVGPFDTARARRVYGAVQEKGFVREWYAGEQPVGEEALAAARALYDAEIRQVDAAVARIVAAVDRVADPATTTLLVVSDHGEGFGEHGHVGHAFSVYDTLLRVPVIARGPGFEPGLVQHRPVQLTDVAPTLLAAAGLGPEEGPGRDLRLLHDEPRVLAASYAYPEQVLGTFPPAVRTSERLAPHLRSFGVALDGRFKLIVDSRGQRELYDLEADPEEASPLDRLEPALLQRLEAVATAGLAGDGEGAELGELDEETRAALRELGYIE